MIENIYQFNHHFYIMIHNIFNVVILKHKLTLKLMEKVKN
jgi:hypothetical protein